MKYIIEIENEPFGRNDDPVIPHGMDELYRAKGFKSLVFDQNGLDKLTPYTEPDEDEIRQMAYEEAWEFAKQVSIMKPEDKRDLWGTDKYNTINFGYSYAEAKAKYDKWEKEKDCIRVGDELINHIGRPYVIYHIDRDTQSAYGIDVINREYPLQQEVFPTENYTPNKTGRYFPEITELVKKMREE